MNAKKVAIRLSSKRPNKLGWHEWAIKTKKLAAQAGIQFGDIYGVGGDYDSELWANLFRQGLSPEKAVEGRADSAAAFAGDTLAEMRVILTQFGFDPAAAAALQAEGMGPHELEDRARHMPGTVGSLEHSHNLRRSRS
jgi:hypothetical protein